ncbi:hypothetical protein IDH50_11815 [Aeromicrobium tamlense]|uniref:Uncharacterized protein n=1 Tax=Aeromicrobium tamlense TaxID=375541 RepID=A0A8I0KHG9_9ACTN|nr:MULTISPECIES: hypothetical protein [Aeromicrobium]MBD1270921.1 hypothetical protein [Aeromicrobium tamlense]NYI38312.1 hypothetical protein [Aeromicrobium tamlense]
MVAPAAPVARVVRAGSVSLWSTLIAVGAHVSGSGQPPPAVVLVPVVAAGAALAWWAAARRIGFAVALGLLAVPQVVVHVLTGYVHGHDVVPGVGMLVAHVLGLGVVAAGIALAERLWWSWWRHVTFVLRLVRPVTAPVPVALALRGAEPLHPSALLEHIVVRRGPPFSRVVTAPVARICG